MSRTLTASDRKRLIKMASTMAVGSPERKAILKGLSKSAGKAGDFKAGDLVRYTGKFLRNTGMAVGAPVDGKVVEVKSEGYFAGHPVVQWSDGGGPSLVRAENIQHARRMASGSKSASFTWPSVRREIERELKQHPAFIDVWDEVADENVFALLVEYSEDDVGYEGGFRVEVYDQNGDLITEEAAPRGKRTNLRPYVKDAQKDWNDAYRSASGRRAGLQSKGLSKSAATGKVWRTPVDALRRKVKDLFYDHEIRRVDGDLGSGDGYDEYEGYSGRAMYGALSPLAFEVFEWHNGPGSDIGKALKRLGFMADRLGMGWIYYLPASGRMAGFQSKGLKKTKVASDSLFIPFLMPVRGGSKEVMPANGTDFKLREVQKMIGGYVEVVYLRDGRIMLVDEEGLLKGLPLNRAASRMAGRPIVGNALVMPDDMFR